MGRCVRHRYYDGGVADDGLQTALMRNLIGLVDLKGDRADGGRLDRVAEKLHELGLMVPKFTVNGEGYDRLDKWKPGERVDLVGHPYYLKRRA